MHSHLVQQKALIKQKIKNFCFIKFRNLSCKLEKNNVWSTNSIVEYGNFMYTRK